MILKNIKGTTARKANQLLGRTGRFWQKEYFDRYIRDSKHFYAVFNYIENNPVKARLCRSKEDCKFSSAFKPGSA
jgi:REP element-mobilizing transposase RayT